MCAMVFLGRMSLLCGVQQVRSASEQPDNVQVHAISCKLKFLWKEENRHFFSYVSRENFWRVNISNSRRSVLVTAMRRVFTSAENNDAAHLRRSLASVASLVHSPSDLDEQDEATEGEEVRWYGSFLQTSRLQWLDETGREKQHLGNPSDALQYNTIRYDAYPRPFWWNKNSRWKLLA